MAIKLPNLTRVDKAIGCAHEDLKVSTAFWEMDSFIKKRYRVKYWDSEERKRIFQELFLLTYDVDNAVYRRDFLWDILDCTPFRRLFKKVYGKIPSYYLRYVETHGEFGEQRSLSAIKNDVYRIRRYLMMPETLEMMAEFSGTSQGVRDLAAFTKRARKSLEDYAKFVKPLKEKPLIKGDIVDIEWANHCVDKISPYQHRIQDIAKIKTQMKYFIALAHPYESECDGERRVYCKPEFLDSGLRTGTIKNAYHPAYFKYPYKYDDKGNRVVERVLNVPNDINWNDSQRATFIQGPNSMGKTVYLLTAALNIHLPMAGLLPFADSCVMSLVRKIHPCFDLGDTFGKEGHFVTGADKINDMLRTITIEDIVLLDEAGGGTEPEAERKISKGLSDAFIQYGITFFDVTHDSDAWKKHKKRKGVHMLRVADLNDEKRRYNVWPGIAKGGYAMQIAEEKGIDPKSVKERLEKQLKC